MSDANAPIGPLTLDVLSTAAGPRVAVGGALDFETAPEFRELLPTLELRPGQRLVLDLGGIEFFDSSGISALLAARTLVLATEARLELTAVPDLVVHVLDAVGLEEVFDTGALSRGGTSDRTSDRMPDRFPDRLPDRMPDRSSASSQEED